MQHKPEVLISYLQYLLLWGQFKVYGRRGSNEMTDRDQMADTFMTREDDCPRAVANPLRTEHRANEASASTDWL